MRVKPTHSSPERRSRHAISRGQQTGLRRLVVLTLVAGLGAHAEVASAATQVPTTTYTQNTTWTLAGSPYVINGNVTIASGATLTIEPGVIVKFGYVYASARKILVAAGAALNAAGTAAQPISFTSIKDDSIGGDTGADGPTSCIVGQGGYIEVQSANPANLISSAVIRCGPYPGAVDAGVRVVGTDSTLTVTDLTLNKMNAHAFSVSGGDLALVRATITEMPTGSGVNVINHGAAFIADTTIIGTPNCACRGIKVADGTVTVERTTLRDLWQGGQIVLSSSFSGPASSFFDSTIRDNSGWGLYIEPYPTLPLSKWPYGQRNNIYGNSPDDPIERQLIVGFGSLPSFADWSNNYWGEYNFWHAFWMPNHPTCLPWLGFVTYLGGTPGSPLSPISSWSFPRPDGQGLCGANYVWAPNPASEPF